MNLHAVVSGAINKVNPFVVATVRRSTGYTTNSDGSRVPTYFDFNITCQVQALTFQDITQLAGLNIQGVRRAIYLTGEVEAVVRVAQKGGDLVIFAPGTLPEGNTWQAMVVLEAWPDWRKIALTLQDQ